MIKEAYQLHTRSLHTKCLQSDLAVVGGGLAGVCAAITAARQGISTILIQDRPVLGGNASSEIRLWILGATSHMGNNNRWAREGGVVDEILSENFYRNPEGNPVILDTILLEKVIQEPNIQLLLNTVVFDLRKSSDRLIEKVYAYCSQSTTYYEISATVFCDASGDGIVGFKAGASFRMGAESKLEFGEGFAPDESYGQLLGHSIYFYSKRAPKPVKYIPPAFALKDIRQIPRYKIIDKDDHGCRFWWLEYGGHLDTIHETEEIKWELWKVVYGVWDYIKNSGKFEDVENLTLEWVGAIPGKRESRRFEGLYMLRQQDLVEQQVFEDAVAYGGWAMDLHPAEGVYSSLPGCTQWHTKGIYQIPYRCYVSKDIDNLFLAGRIISASHVAFGSSRVMATCGLGAQAVGMAAALCIAHSVTPRTLLQPHLMKQLQHQLNLAGQSIPGIPLLPERNLASLATLSASSELMLSEIPPDGTWLTLQTGVAQLLPLASGVSYLFQLWVDVLKETKWEIQLRISSKLGNYTPDVMLEKVVKKLVPGEQMVEVQFSTTLSDTQYAFLVFSPNAHVRMAQSSKRYTGILSVYNGKNKSVSNNGRQQPPPDTGIDSFEFWIPYRRPEGKNLAMKIFPALSNFKVANLTNGYVRPYLHSNAWIATEQAKAPRLYLQWKHPQKIRQITLFFDNDYDHPMESVLMGHPENETPFCVKNCRVIHENMIIASVCNNHQSVVNFHFQEMETTELVIELERPDVHVPAALFEVQIR